MRVSSLFIFGTGSADRFSFLNLRHAPSPPPHPLRLTHSARQKAELSHSFLPSRLLKFSWTNIKTGRAAYTFSCTGHIESREICLFMETAKHAVGSFLSKWLLLHVVLFFFVLHSLNFSYTSFYQVPSYSNFYPRWLLVTNHFIDWT